MLDQCSQAKQEKTLIKQSLENVAPARERGIEERQDFLESEQEVIQASQQNGSIHSFVQSLSMHYAGH